MLTALAQAVDTNSAAARQQINDAVRLIEMQDYEDAVEALDELMAASGFDQLDDSLRADVVLNSLKDPGTQDLTPVELELIRREREFYDSDRARALISQYGYVSSYAIASSSVYP